MNEPTTHEGWTIWDMVTHINTHLRHAGMAGAVVGLDAVSFLTVGEARGIPRALLAEFLPSIEVAVIQSIRKARDADGG